MITAGHAFSRILVDEVQFKAAAPHERDRGLLGYVKCRLNGALLLDGITVRRTSNGRLTLSFPARRDRLGLDHPLVRPVDDRTRVDLETQILGALGVGEASA